MKKNTVTGFWEGESNKIQTSDHSLTLTFLLCNYVVRNTLQQKLFFPLVFKGTLVSYLT